MALTDLVFELAKADLSAPRVLLPQVVHYITDHYGYTSDAFDRFFAEKYPTLEPYELDLIFSPQFTPGEHNRLDYIPVLGENALSPEEVAALKRRLRDAELQTVVRTPDEQIEHTLAIDEVFSDRYINLLKLDARLPEGFYHELVTHVPEASRNEVNLLARDEVWQFGRKADILTAFVRVGKARGNFSTLKLSFLTNFVRTYRPASLLDLERQLDSLIDSCRTDMENVQGRGFHDEYLKAINMSSALNKAGEQDAWAHYHHLMEMAQQLKDDYQYISEVCPDLLEKARTQQPV